MKNESILKYITIEIKKIFFGNEKMNYAHQKNE